MEELRDLPTLPEVAIRVMQVADSEAVDLHELTLIIESDPALASKVLRLANSSQAGMLRRATSIGAAVTWMGLAAVKSAVLSIGVFQAFLRSEGKCPDHKKLWIHSIAVASASAVMASGATTVADGTSRTGHPVRGSMM